MRFILSIIISIFLFGCRSNCENLPEFFGSYEEAKELVVNAHFELVEEIECQTKSSWIGLARYYSCDSKTGFLIIQLNSNEYIYSNVPFEVWKQFKNSDSFGYSYNQLIRGRYKIKLN